MKAKKNAEHTLEELKQKYMDTKVKNEEEMEKTNAEQ
jgi:hypothetical protein